MPPTSLEDLPAELITAILYTLASPTALRSLIQASARSYKIFLLCKDHILLTILHDVLQPEIKSLLLLVHEAYHLPPFSRNPNPFPQRQRRQDVDTFIDKFCRVHQFDEQILHLPVPNFISPQLRTVCTMEYFVEDYCNWVSDHLQSTQAHRSIPEPWKGMLRPPHAHQGLSHVEQARLQRAFVRFEIFCSAMHCAGGHDRNLLAKHYTQQNNDRFLNILRPWEREEWVCVLDYLSARVEAVFDRLELDYVERMTERFLSGEMDHEMSAINDSSSKEDETDIRDQSVSIAGAQDPALADHKTNGGQCEARDTSVDFFTTSTKQKLHSRYVEHLITLGLPFLRRLFQSRIKDQQEAVFSNLNLAGEMANLIGRKWIDREQSSLLRREGADAITNQLRQFRQLGAAVAITNIAAAAGPPVPAGLAAPGHIADVPARDNERAMTFEGDHVGKPNLGFLWTHGFTGTNVCNRSCDHLHRALGYVFWDQWRLEDMGLVEQKHWWRWKHLKQRNRWQEKSAQERLAQMGFVMPVVEKLVLNDGDGDNDHD